jgi:hypothetical protein
MNDLLRKRWSAVKLTKLGNTSLKMERNLLQRNFACDAQCRAASFFFIMEIGCPSIRFSAQVTIPPTSRTTADLLFILPQLIGDVERQQKKERSSNQRRINHMPEFADLFGH